MSFRVLRHGPMLPVSIDPSTSPNDTDGSSLVLGAACGKDSRTLNELPSGRYRPAGVVTSLPGDSMPPHFISHINLGFHLSLALRWCWCCSSLMRRLHRYISP